MGEPPQITHQHTQPGDYLVLGRDATGIQDGLSILASAHWDYIDRFAPQLIARGPLLTPNGQDHTGSIHIITSPNIQAAQRFASEEPYCQAHFYSSVTVTPFSNLLGRTMWECAPSIPPECSTFMQASWPARSFTSRQIEQIQATISINKCWVFLGLLFSTNGDCIGIAAAADLKLEAAECSLQRLLSSSEIQLASIESSRWCRGGRS